jgi:hypothetical protein
MLQMTYDGQRRHRWFFPLPRTHTGMLLGNGRLGAMIWGEGSVLRVTLGRADHWEHRGGLSWREGMTYSRLRQLLEAGDEPGLRAFFHTDVPAGAPRRPTTLPIGRIELDFGADARLLYGDVDFATGVVTVTVAHAGRTCAIDLAMHPSLAALALQLPEGLPRPVVGSVPAWEYVGGTLADWSYTPPEMICTDDHNGWLQRCPGDPGISVLWRRHGHTLLSSTERGAEDEPVTQTRRTLDEATRLGWDGIRSATEAWHRSYWKRVPRVRIDGPQQFIYDYGTYKFAGLTKPDGVAATLQGPWVEEYQLPPWSNDYHFNINVQLCYSPAFGAGLFDHLQPLWDLLQSWRPQLRHNARVLAEIDDGLMLPHAVDDRATCMGGFWTGAIDHGATAWVAAMMMRQYRFTRDTAFLRDVAWPFMLGVMRVYEAMLEKQGDRFVLPLSVSPEFGGAAMDAWGRNASFQLACMHRLLEDLGEAAVALGRSERPLWGELRSKLPKATVESWNGASVIALWEGRQLDESHRHHSHLAGITPFDVIDIADPQWRPVVIASLRQWIAEGWGRWSGWCMPWAAMIHARVGNADAAALILDVWQRVFTNEGHGTLHDAHFPGISLTGADATTTRPKTSEKMQMDAGMAAVTAVQEMLLHHRRGVNMLFAGAPQAWGDASFEGLHTEGGFRVSARREGNRVAEITVESPHGGTFRFGAFEPLKLPEGPDVQARGDGVYAVETKPGEVVTLKA